jgi:hypothetical protein
VEPRCAGLGGVVCLLLRRAAVECEGDVCLELQLGATPADLRSQARMALVDARVAREPRPPLELPARLRR